MKKLNEVIGEGCYDIWISIGDYKNWNKIKDASQIYQQSAWYSINDERLVEYIKGINCGNSGDKNR